MLGTPKLADTSPLSLRLASFDPSYSSRVIKLADLGGFQQFKPSSVTMSRVEQFSALALSSKHSSTSLPEKRAPLTTPVHMGAGSELHRTALEVSNLIHGTAFSFGFPDARATWKPKYHYSELDGWISNIDTCL